MERMDRAKQRLLDEHLTCAVIGPEGEYISAERGIKPVMRWLQESPQVLKDASVADKVIGKAAALLFVQGGVCEVWAGLISVPALAVFQTYQIPCFYQELVDRIKNRAGDGLCPMETRTLKIEDPAEAFQIFRELLN